MSSHRSPAPTAYGRTWAATAHLILCIVILATAAVTVSVALARASTYAAVAADRSVSP